ncbi:AAA family ATPase [Chryseobacterium flavum]|uniref:AAA family ATPase n=1 Tax=Chryseobacterium flavum TaxID=415851 RepID=UPI002FD89AB9
MNENNFRFLAIRPLSDCEDIFLKNLSKGTIYKFYKEYTFKDSSGNEIIDSLAEVSEINYNLQVPTNLYQVTDEAIEINISALVGKNGSGKSSLLELLYASCYVIASKKEILLSSSYFYRKFHENNQWLSDSDRDIWMNIESVYQNLSVELYYSIGTQIYCVKLDRGAVDHILISGENDNFVDGYYHDETQEDYSLCFVMNEIFFYTISINYSLYGLNSTFMGNWVNELFHKNDGYQTPLVINPFRKKGNIDVNSELHLAQTRLLTNIINNELVNVVNGKEIDTVVFEINTNKYKEEVDKDLDELYNTFKKDFGFSDSNFISNVYNRLYGGTKYGNIEILGTERPNFEYQCKYVFRKILKISSNYLEYKDWVKINGKEKRADFKNFFTFLSELNEDRSHITLKLRQVLNNIRFNLLHNSIENMWIKEDNNQYYKIKLQFLIRRLKTFNKKGLFSYEELLPIGCFNTILWIKNNESKDSVRNIDVLSSGEQHFIHSIHSILYHLFNINSVFENKKTKKIKYRYINIILDEIELYYHPEFQRIFVSELLERIKLLSIPNIKGINILFCTHSPFILSDIPVQNTLKLENGRIKNDLNDRNTLGANIHDLLDNDFYLRNGFMGEYIQDKIFSLINFLDKDEREQHFIKFNHVWTKENAFNFIELIGEPLLKGTLQELYYNKYNSDIDKEIERLINLKNSIK